MVALSFVTHILQVYVSITSSEKVFMYFGRLIIFNFSKFKFWLKSWTFWVLFTKKKTEKVEGSRLKSSTSKESQLYVSLSISK